MAVRTLTCREVSYNINTLWDEEKQINYVDVKTPIVDRNALCALTVDGRLFSYGAPINKIIGTDPTYGGQYYDDPPQFTESFVMFYDPANEAAVVSLLTGLSGLGTHAYTVQYGI